METDQGELLKVITSLFFENNIPYMITGAWSVIFYGRPRASHDIDFVVDLLPKDITRSISIFNKLSPEFSYDPDDIREQIKKNGMFQILYLPEFLKFDIWILKKNQFDLSRFQRRIEVKILGQMMTIATQEDTILQKLRWYSKSNIEKHIVDAAFVFKIQKEKLDFSYLQKWIKLLKVEKYYNEMQKIDLEKYL